MKKVCVSLLVLLLIVRTNTIGVRQLQEFGDAKKQVEQLIRAYRQSGERSEDWYKKFEAQLAIIAKTDKKTADVYRAQMPKKIGKSEEVPVQEELFKPKLIKLPSKASQDVIFSESKTISEEKEKFSLDQDDEPVLESKVQKQKEREELAFQPITETSPWATPIITSKPQDRETVIISSTSPWSVPVSKEQVKAEKKKLEEALNQRLQKLETAIDQASNTLPTLNFNTLITAKALNFKTIQFKNWNESINNYQKELEELKSVNSALYQEKKEKVKKIQTLFFSKLLDQITVSIEQIRNKMAVLIKKFADFKLKIKLSLFSSDYSEFNQAAYQYFFGLFTSEGIATLKNKSTRSNVGWFKDGDVRARLSSLFESGIQDCFDLCFEYYNRKTGIVTRDQADVLKAKMNALKDKVKEYKQLLAMVYNGMKTIQKGLPADDKRLQDDLIEDEYERHLIFLQDVETKIQNNFLYRLWPDDRPATFI